MSSSDAPCHICLWNSGLLSLNYYYICIWLFYPYIHPYIHYPYNGLPKLDLVLNLMKTLVKHHRRLSPLIVVLVDPSNNINSNEENIIIGSFETSGRKLRFFQICFLTLGNVFGIQNARQLRFSNDIIFISQLRKLNLKG